MLDKKEEDLKDALAEHFELKCEKAQLKQQLERKQDEEKPLLLQQQVNGLEQENKHLRKDKELLREIEKDRDYWKDEFQKAKAVPPRSNEFQERQLAKKEKEIQDSCARLRVTWRNTSRRARIGQRRLSLKRCGRCIKICLSNSLKWSQGRRRRRRLTLT